VQRPGVPRHEVLTQDRQPPSARGCRLKLSKDREVDASSVEGPLVQVVGQPSGDDRHDQRAPATCHCKIEPTTAGSAMGVRAIAETMKGP